MLDDEVLTLAVAKVPEALAKPLAPERDIAGRKRRQKSYARDLASLLRFDHDRCKKQAEIESDREHGPPHRHLVVLWLRGSLAELNYGRWVERKMSWLSEGIFD